MFCLKPDILLSLEIKHRFSLFLFLYIRLKFLPYPLSQERGKVAVVSNISKNVRSGTAATPFAGAWVTNPQPLRRTIIIFTLCPSYKDRRIKRTF
jgi:hypothetical protein